MEKNHTFHLPNKTASSKKTARQSLRSFLTHTANLSVPHIPLRISSILLNLPKISVCFPTYSLTGMYIAV